VGHASTLTNLVSERTGYNGRYGECASNEENMLEVHAVDTGLEWFGASIALDFNDVWSLSKVFKTIVDRGVVERAFGRAKRLDEGRICIKCRNLGSIK
jgi:hypothetical protein